MNDDRLYLRPEEMLKSWESAICNCDMSVGWICERCHDIHVLKQLIAERDALKRMVLLLSRENDGRLSQDSL